MKGSTTFLLLTLCLAQVCVSQKLFRCFFYFDKEFVSYNLKSLYLEEDPKYHEYNYVYNFISGKIFVNLCDGVMPPDSCNGSNASKNLFSRLYFLFDFNQSLSLNFVNVLSTF